MKIYKLKKDFKILIILMKNIFKDVLHIRVCVTILNLDRERKNAESRVIFEFHL